MSRYSKYHDPKRSARLAWLSQNICQYKSDAELILEMMAIFPPVTEKTCREELKEVFKRYAEINAENLPDQRTKYLEVGWNLLREMTSNFQYGPAANLYKTMAHINGILQDNVKVDQTIHTDPTPKPEIVRDRTSTLMADPKIRERARKLGLDLDDKDLKDDDK